MSEIWERVAPLKEISEFVRDGTHASFQRVSHGKPLLSAKNITEGGDIAWDGSDSLVSEADYRAISRSFRITRGDVLLTIVGSIGRVALCRNDDAVAFQRSVAVIRPRSDLIDPDFLAHLLRTRSVQSELLRRANATAQAGVYLGELDQVLIPVPSLVEQRKIAEILDTAHKAIRSTEQLIAKLEQVKRCVLRDLLAREASSWRISNVDSEFDIKSGITLDSGRVPRNHPKPYLRVANVRRGHIDVSDIAFLEASSDDSTSYALAMGDLLVVEGHANPREIGRCAIVEEGQAGLLYQNHLFRLRSRRLLPEFGLLLLNSEFARNYWWRMCATSSGLNTINSRQLRALPVPVPDEREQARIVDLAKGASSRLQVEQRELDKLRLLKQGLMDDLLAGRVRVGVSS